jgi:hypothetical protein
MARTSIQAAIVVGMTAMLGSGRVALAAAPANDTYAGRIVIASEPHAELLDTSEATTEPLDGEMNTPQCGAPATGASVWYELTAPSDGHYLIDVSGSDYSAGAIVATGSPGAFVPETCGPNSVDFQAIAGQTYTFLVFDDGLDGGGNGGTLSFGLLSVPAPPDPTIDSFSIDPFGSFNSRTGTVTISGTLSCTGSVAFVGMTVWQNAGRFVVTGSGFSTDVTCHGTPRAWAMEVLSDNGSKFAGGKALNVTFAGVCTEAGCVDRYTEQVVTLRGK